MKEMDIIISKNNVPIRLTGERWEHITKSHDYMASYFLEILESVADPDFIAAGSTGALIAVKQIGKGRKYIVVVYREESRKDGFVITAFLTKKLKQLKRRKIIWQKH